jgi:acetyl esterase/lipase
LIAQPAPRATRRLKYGDGPLHSGDLWLPDDGAPSGGKRTTVVFIHGGCWEAKYNLEHASYAAAALAKAGYVVWVPEYRRIGDDGGGWPGTFDDVAAAVDFVGTIARSEAAIDISRVIVSGHSAGGQLALWIASRQKRSRAPIGVIGVVSLAGITDLAAYGAASGGCNASVTPLLGGRPSEVGERYRAVSPIELLPIGVPLQLVHGALDSIVPVAMAEAFAQKAAAAGDHVDVTTITSGGHFDVIAPQTSAWQDVIAAFQGISPPR